MQSNGESPGAGDPTPEPEVHLPGTGAARGFFRDSREHPVLITEAATSLDEQHRARVRRYMLIMGFRIPCLILAAVAYSVFENPLISILIIAASVPLPWVAVLIANDRPPRTKDEPSRWDGRREEIALEARSRKALE
ncbi:DUF3099 domain-containing protein [Nocardia caishijiensis]|uniref:DUF3099 family protein n=1 Tax=Nocardia caishijiensis TaxID=184756 RepID=A0ABQ6YPX3_9NOCA|nr:DUF3099 domain-containing protein [Nocardia caishijiensis]KAF0847625.1 hypothetical protein FNL39_103527 [Nocardia caishijiensis]